MLLRAWPSTVVQSHFRQQRLAALWPLLTFSHGHGTEAESFPYQSIFIFINNACVYICPVL